MLMLTACTDTTMVQRRYSDMRDKCRESAEQWAAQTLGTLRDQYDERDVNANLTTIFSDCMFTKGWTVATNPREQRDDEGKKVIAGNSSRPVRPQGIGIGPGVEPGRNLPDFSNLEYK